MSGWIKLEKDRRDDPRVLRMARELRHASVTHERFLPAAHVTLVLGCLDQLWCYADTHIREDDTLDLGADEIDELVGLKGFCCLMPADWLVVLDANRVQLPDFHGHNGTESKKQALAQKRQERKRNADALLSLTQTSRTSVTDALPDQTRPDQDHKKNARTNGDARPTPIRMPKDWLPNESNREWLVESGLSPEQQRQAIGEFVAWGSTSELVKVEKNWQLAFRRNPVVKAAIGRSKTKRGSNGVEKAEKHRADIIELADMFNIEQGDDDWPTFEAKVIERNERRLASIGR